MMVFPHKSISSSTCHYVRYLTMWQYTTTLDLSMLQLHVIFARLGLVANSVKRVWLSRFCTLDRVRNTWYAQSWAIVEEISITIFMLHLICKIFSCTWRVLWDHHKHTSPGQLSHSPKRNCKSTTTIDLHISSTDAWWLPRTHAGSVERVLASTVFCAWAGVVLSHWTLIDHPVWTAASWRDYFHMGARKPHKTIPHFLLITSTWVWSSSSSKWWLICV